MIRLAQRRQPHKQLSKAGMCRLDLAHIHSARECDQSTVQQIFHFTHHVQQPRSEPQSPSLAVGQEFLKQRVIVTQRGFFWVQRRAVAGVACKCGLDTVARDADEEYILENLQSGTRGIRQGWSRHQPTYQRKQHHGRCVGEHHHRYSRTDFKTFKNR